MTDDFPGKDTQVQSWGIKANESIAWSASTAEVINNRHPDYTCGQQIFTTVIKPKYHQTRCAVQQPHPKNFGCA
jgi:hypothetical protein